MKASFGNIFKFYFKLKPRYLESRLFLRGCCSTVVSDFWTRLPTREYSVYPPIYLSLSLSLFLPPSSVIFVSFFLLHDPATSGRQRASSALREESLPRPLRPCHGRIIQSTFSSHDDRISLSRSDHVHLDSVLCRSRFNFNPQSNVAERLD